MIHNLRLLEVAAMAALAMSAVGASVAMAEEEFTASSAPATVTGGQTTEHQFITDVGRVTCDTAHFEGTMSVTAVGELTLHPTYDDCFLSGTVIPVTVNTGNDDYTLTTPTNKTGNADVAGMNGILIFGVGCSITIPNQEVGHVGYKNEAGGDILVTATVSSIDYEHSGFLCSPPGSHSNGVYVGTTLLSSPTANLSVD